jgi:16S rRNA (cytosine967-C5)-methyltransferase
VFRTEGEHQIDAFLQRRGASGAHLDSRSPGHLLPLPDNGSSGAPLPDSGVAVASHSVSDGFYYALLRKEPAAGSA